MTHAAVKGDAYNAAQFVTIFRPMSRLVETTDAKTGKPSGKFAVVVDFPDVAEDGAAVVRELTPSQAAKRTEELPEYANLWRSSVVSGIGSGSGAGIAKGGPIDFKKMTQSQYMELREKHPEAIGLRPAHKRPGQR